MVNCTICNGNDFTIESGYYYCSVCGTQSQAIQEIEHPQGDASQNIGLDIRNSARKSRIQGRLKFDNEDTELTSWEEANYILLGMVNQLLDLGICEEFKLVTFQLWATYLEKINAAFFTQNGPALPKLPANYRFKDAKIVYNHKRKDSVRNPRKTSGDRELSFKAKKFRKGRRQKAFINAEYNVFTSENEESNTDTLSTAGFTSDQSNLSLPLEFTPKSRRVLKRKYSNKKHLNAHANDFSKKLKCHAERPRLPLKVALEKPTRHVLLNIIYIALNYVGSEIQLGDFLRYAREGHISIYEFEQFFPENLSNYVNSTSFVGNTFRSAYFPTHIIFRNRTRILTELLNYTDIKQPNILDLCKRYVTELCLPTAIIEIIEKLLLIAPPINMRFDKYYEYFKVIPNYEGRAMGLIIFTLKLLFGLDDDRENSISKSARHINDRIELLVDTKKYPYGNLFIFTDWLKYISKRNVILQQCHYPTAIYFNENPNTSTALYLNYLRQIIPNHFEKMTANENTLTKTRHYLKHQLDTMKNVQNIFDEIENLHTIHDNDNDNADNLHQKINKHPISFPPSLTPSRSYFDQILNDDDLCRKFQIRKSMKCKFDEHDLLTYLNPNRLRLFFDKHDIDVNVRKVPLQLTNLEFCRCFALDDPLRCMYSHFSDDYIKCTNDIKYKKWLKNIHKENQERLDKINLELYQNHLKIKNKIEKKLENQTETDRILKNINKKLLKKIKDSSGVVKCEIISSSSSSDEDDDVDNGKTKQSETKSSNREQITFDITNYDTWIYTGYFNAHAINVFKLQVLDKLPKTYQWLLKQCAFTIECTEKDLYFESLCVENQFAYGVHRNVNLQKNPYRKLTNESYLNTSQNIFYKCW